MGLTLALSLQLWLQGGYSLTQSAGIPQWQSEFDMPWIPRFGISIHLAIDGLSLLMVVLTGLLGVLAVLCSWKEIEKYQGFFQVISAIQRGTLTPKRSVCQHRKPPIKGINISQGSNMAIFIPCKSPVRTGFSTNSHDRKFSSDWG